MVNNIFIGQELFLNYTDTDGKDMDTIDFRVDYWSPSNVSNTPTGTIIPSNITTVPTEAVVVIKVDIGILSEPTCQGRKWRFQIIDNDTGIGWTPMVVDVKNMGSQTFNL